MNLTHWQYKILALLGVNPHSKTKVEAALAGMSKHGRQKRRPANYDRKRKIRRLMARESRRRNQR